MIHPRGYAPILKMTKEYIVVHDMIPFYYDKHYKGYFNRLENFYIMWRLKASIRSCDRVITISEASCKDILNRVKVPKSKISVIYNGYNKITELPECVDKSNYIIAVTSKLPHKNAKGIIEAYEVYFKQCEHPLQLRIIGIGDVEQYALEPQAKENIKCYQYIESNEEMHRMIAEAKIFLFLSLIEGFGFPPVEAMQLGTPVVCSKMSSLPEVVGDAAILVDPCEPDEVADALVKLQNDANKQQELIVKGYHNVERFFVDTKQLINMRIL